jgi:hypothetical protein
VQGEGGGGPTKAIVERSGRSGGADRPCASAVAAAPAAVAAPVNDVRHGNSNAVGGDDGGAGGVSQSRSPPPPEDDILLLEDEEDNDGGAGAQAASYDVAGSRKGAALQPISGEVVCRSARGLHVQVSPSYRPAHSRMLSVR